MEKNVPLRKLVYQATQWTSPNPYDSIVKDGTEATGRFKVHDLRLGGVLTDIYLVPVWSAANGKTRLINVHGHDFNSDECNELMTEARNVSTWRSRVKNTLAYRWQNLTQVPTWGDVQQVAFGTSSLCYIALVAIEAGLYGLATAPIKNMADIDWYEAITPELRDYLERDHLIDRVRESFLDGRITVEDVSFRGLIEDLMEDSDIFSLPPVNPNDGFPAAIKIFREPFQAAIDANQTQRQQYGWAASGLEELTANEKLPDDIKQSAAAFLSPISEQQQKFPQGVAVDSDLGAQLTQLIEGYHDFLNSPEIKAEIARMCQYDADQLIAQNQALREAGYGFLGLLTSIASWFAFGGMIVGGGKARDLFADWRYRRRNRSQPNA